MFRKRPPRLSPSAYRGAHRYFLTIRTYRGDPIFARTEFAAVAATHLQRCSETFRFAVLAYCFMPDHVHLLVEGTRFDACVTEFVRVWKQMTAYDAKRGLGVRLWQRGYFDRVVRDDQPIDGIVAYIRENPVRAALVKSADEYRWSGAFPPRSP